MIKSFFSSNRDFNRELEEAILMQDSSARTLNELKFERSEITKERQNAEQERNKVEKEISSVEDKINHIKHRISGIETERRNYEAIRANQMARFGRDAPKIVELIKKHVDRFEKAPLGPVGKECLRKNHKIFNFWT